MIVHRVVTEKSTINQTEQGGHKKIYVGCAECDTRYRDMLVNGRHRWSFYTTNTFDFRTYDRRDSNQWKKSVKKIISESDGVMYMVSENTARDFNAIWEINLALSMKVPIVGVDIRKKYEGEIPEKLRGKMTRFGWEWIADFIDGL